MILGLDPKCNAIVEQNVRNTARCNGCGLVASKWWWRHRGGLKPVFGVQPGGGPRPMQRKSDMRRIGYKRQKRPEHERL